MGSERRRNRRRQREKQSQNAGRQKADKTEAQAGGAGYAEFIKENKNFDTFYKAQNFIPPEEWDKFQDILRQPLPTTFRITQYRNHAKVLLKIIESDYFAKLTKTEGENSAEENHEFFPLPWYPDKLAWQVNISRKEIRKNDACQKLHSFLISETSSGNISRQEAVSMIPPVILDVQPHHKVLDMCAAPGSKTAQLIEMLHVNDKTIPEGIVIANDVDNKRCYMLVHQTKRLQSPSLIITNNDAGAMPNILLSGGKTLKFDRILCDVPCSGDGTLRKNADIWSKWNLGNCINFHSMQARILKRGLELLEVGGKIVYSTCSMCPLEDESVIHHILSLCGDSVELIDATDRVPGLKFLPGLSHWPVMNKQLEVIPSPDEIPERNKSLIKAHMFPPSAEDAPKYNLHRCLRVLPHLQNSGGFFVALLRKVKLLPWEVNKHLNPKDNEEQPVSASGEGEDGVPQCKRKAEKSEDTLKKKLKHQGFREDPYIYFDDDNPIWSNIKNTYEMDSTFDPSLLMTRTAVGKKKTLYFTSKIVKEVVTLNAERVKIINTGIKLFCRCDNNNCSATEFRLTQEGLLTVFPYLNSRVLTISKDDVIYLLSTQFPSINEFSQPMQAQLESYKENGSLALSYEEISHDASAEKLYFVLCGWKGASTLRAYITKDERIHYLRLCGADTTEFENKKMDKDNEESKMEIDDVENGNEDVTGETK